MSVEDISIGLSAQILRPVYEMFSYKPELLRSLQEKFSLPSQESIGDEGERVCARQTARMLLELVHLYGYRDIGLSIGGNLPVGCFGSFSYLMVTAPNLREMLNDFCEYYSVIAETLHAPHWAQEGTEFYIELFPADEPNDDNLVLSDLALAAAYRLLQHAAPTTFKATRVHICGNGGGYRGRYRDCLGTDKLQFGSDVMRIYADAAILDSQLPSANRTLRGVFKKELGLLLRESKVERNIIDQIHRVFSQSDNLSKVGLVDVANQLSLGERTLTRKLSAYNLSFRELLSNYKSTRSVRMLAEGRSVDEVSYFLGFSERAAFDRAFKKWQGVTASRFQETFRASGATSANLFDHEQLPSLPATANQLLQLINDQNADMAELAKVVEQDPAITAKLMALANSAMYGAIQSATIKEAIIKVFGVERLRNLALAMLVNSCFDTSACPAFSLRAYWIKALASGQLAAELAKYHQQIDAEQAYLFGLLHNIGTLFLVQQRSAQMQMVLVNEEFEQCTLQRVCEIEREILDVDACAVGSMLAAFWNLPRFLISGIREVANQNYDGEQSALVHLVAASEDTVRRMSQSLLDVELASEKLQRVTGLDQTRIQPLLVDFQGRFESVKSAVSGLT